MEYKAINGNVFVEEVKASEEVGSMIVPDSLENDFKYGKVISCATGYIENGVKIPIPFKVGDEIVFPKQSSIVVTMNNKKMLLVRYPDIVGMKTNDEP